MADARWYAIQSYPGHENKVQRLIQRRIDEEPGEPAEKEVQEVLVPTQEVVELRNGKRVSVTRRVCGYLGSPDARPFNAGKQEEVQRRVKHLDTGQLG